MNQGREENEMDFKLNDDHWAFLEDIEAPMWVDLSLVADSNHQDIDDRWFYATHEFHQCSSDQLKSVFSHFGDGSTILDPDFLGPSSPKLPHSVSKSRGKEYRNRKWKGKHQDFSLDNEHPMKVLTGKSSNAKHGDRVKVKNKSTFSHSKEASSFKTSVVSESSSSGKAVSNFSNPETSSSSEANKTSDSNPRSTITSEICHQKQVKIMEVSSHGFDHTSGLLSMMKKTLRKSYITRQAARVEIITDEKQLQGRNSTSSKSSVGSSSNPRSDGRISISTSLRPKEIASSGRNVARLTYVPKSKTNTAEIVKPSGLKSEEGTSNNRRAGQANAAKPGRNKATIQKVQYRDSRTKALVPSRVNEQNATLAATKLKKKTGIDESRKLVGDGKENVKGQIREGIANRGQKGTREALGGPNGKPGTIHSKGKEGRGNSEKPKKLVHRVHFR